MANSTASIIIKPTAAFNRDDTFVFGSWVCVAGGAGSFQCYLTMIPNLETRLVKLPKAVVGTVVEKFDEISLNNQAANFESGSASNSNSMSPWVIACEPTSEPSCETIPLREKFTYGLCNSSRAHADVDAKIGCHLRAQHK
jgi:hypothetical protein